MKKRKRIMRSIPMQFPFIWRILYSMEILFLLILEWLKYLSYFFFFSYAVHLRSRMGVVDSLMGQNKNNFVSFFLSQ